MPMLIETTEHRIFQCEDCSERKEFASIEAAVKGRWVVHSTSADLNITNFVLCPICMDDYIENHFPMWGKD